MAAVASRASASILQTLAQQRRHSTTVGENVLQAAPSHRREGGGQNKKNFQCFKSAYQYQTVRSKTIRIDDPRNTLLNGSKMVIDYFIVYLVFRHFRTTQVAALT